MDVLTSPRWLRRWALASLIANMGIVITGGLVRLTASGLGCNTWPQCEPGSYVPRPEAGIHSYIEFGNRLLTFVLAAIAIGMALAAWRARRNGQPRRRLRVLSIGVGLGIILQAVVGGVSVWLQLNPWVVGLHMVLSVALIVSCTLMVHDAYDLEPSPAPARTLWLARAIFGLSMLLIYLGTVVTGAGPHSGDGGAERNGLELTAIARWHSLTMWLTLVLLAALVATSRHQPRVLRASLGVVAVAVLQGLIGYIQYFTALPMLLVLGHLAGTVLYTVAVTHLVLGVRAEDQNRSGSMAAARNTIAR